MDVDHPRLSSWINLVPPGPSGAHGPDPQPPFQQILEKSWQHLATNSKRAGMV